MDKTILRIRQLSTFLTYPKGFPPILLGIKERKRKKKKSKRKKWRGLVSIARLEGAQHC